MASTKNIAAGMTMKSPHFDLKKNCNTLDITDSITPMNKNN
jgi:hypothetical protein